MPNLDPICSAISYEMANWGNRNPSEVLNQWFFVIGNGIEIESGSFKLESPFMRNGVFVHEFPSFESLQKRLPQLQEKWLGLERELQGMFSSTYSPEELETRAQKEMEKHHRLIRVGPDDLAVEALLSQIEGSISDPRRKMLSGEYLYARPYPLSGNHSDVFFLSEESPASVLWVAHQFCKAWLIYLDRELETGNFHVSTKRSYADKEWTRTHAEMLRPLVTKLRAFLDLTEGLEST